MKWRLQDVKEVVDQLEQMVDLDEDDKMRLNFLN